MLKKTASGKTMSFSEEVLTSDATLDFRRNPCFIYSFPNFYG